MQIPFDFVNIIHLAATILGIVSGLVILYFSIKNKPGNLPLAFGQITLSLGVWDNFALVSKLLVHWPFLFRTGSFFALLFVPLPFLYVLYYTQKEAVSGMTSCISFPPLYTWWTSGPSSICLTNKN